jgi:hypothetical protein
MAAFWVVALCNLVEVTDVSEVLAASIIRAMMVESTSETSENFYQTTWRCNPEDNHLPTDAVRISDPA